MYVFFCHFTGNIESVELYKAPNATVTDNRMDYKEDTTLPQYFGCKVTGGYPRPVVSVHVGDGENVENIALTSNVDMTIFEGNDLGLQVSSVCLSQKILTVILM